MKFNVAAAILGTWLLSQSGATAQSLNGQYNITVQCALGNGYGELSVTGSGRNYSISGSSRGGSYTGSIRDGRVVMKFVGSGNEAEFAGSASTTGQMSGSLTQNSSFGGTCSWTATRVGGAPAPISSAAVKDNSSEICGLVLGTDTVGCSGTDEKCGCVTFRNTCPYPVSVSVRVSGLKRLQVNSPQAGKTGRVCATKEANQQVEYMGFKPWAGFPKRGQPRPTSMPIQ